MAILAHAAPAVKSPPDAIDREPLSGRARNAFEASLCGRAKRSAQLVLRIVLDHAGGRADAWPSNGRIAEIAGYKARNVQVILRQLEAAGLVRCCVDRSLKAQRRIVVLDHPNALKVLAKLGISWMQLGAQAEAAKPARKVGAGAQNLALAGAQNVVGAGAQRRPSELLNPELGGFKSSFVPLDSEGIDPVWRRFRPPG
jgi:hypothetical protein